jgi:CHAT domain-containing protein
MGLVSALFALGTRSLIALVVPVADAAVRPLMAALHEGLREGRRPAAALALAQADQSGAGDALAASASFVCFGAG